MSGWFGRIALVVVIAAVSFAGVILAAPTFIMSVAIERASQGAPNSMHASPRVTEQSRAIVRPSPDLAYSVCSYDLSAGPVRVTVAAWSDYWSLSLFAANTDNFWTGNDRAFPEGLAVVLTPKGQPVMASLGETVVESPSTKGLALIRRLAPTAEAFAAVEAVRAGDSCAAIR
jgi:uncharacterized membrane protein